MVTPNRALPERFAHNKVQFQIVCVLALLAMFTHMHIPLKAQIKVRRAS